MMLELCSPLLSIAVLVSLAATISAYDIHFVNRCPYTVWPAVGKAPNGQPDTSVKFGTKLISGQTASFGVDDNQIGIRAWGRTGCDGRVFITHISLTLLAKLILEPLSSSF